MMAEAVYTLSVIVSVLCAALLWRGYRRTRARLLLWSALCFVGLAGNNALLFLDLVIFPEVDMPVFYIGRGLSALAGISLLLYGMVWDAR